jgi:hypothetical protein
MMSELFMRCKNCYYLLSDISIEMKITFFPQTKAGWLSLKAIVSFLVFLGIFFVVVKVGVRGGDTFFSQPFLAIPISIAGIFGVLAFFVGVVDLLKNKKPAILVFLSILIGLFVMIFISGEFLSPH